MREVDARKMACPTPVLMTKEAIEGDKPESISVLVDNEAASQNVSRFLKNKRYEATIENTEKGFLVRGHRGPVADDNDASEPEKDLTAAKKIMVMVTTDRMGYGDDILGAKLMKNFIGTLREMGPELWRMVFVNNGVKLTVENAEVLSALEGLEHSGVQILVCGTCLEHYGLLDKKRVGETTNMLDIVTAMQLADQVINI